MREWPKYYILVDRLPVAVDLMTWAKGFAKNRFVASDDIGNIQVSTIFLGVDHNWREAGDPVLFETMILDGGGRMWRYSSYAAAMRGHADAVAQVKREAAQIRAITDK